jgi:hypothetical protein
MPEILVEIPEAVGRFVLAWSQDDYCLSVEIHENEVVIVGDQNGLSNLGIQLLSLARNDVFSGYHLHFDKGQFLDDNSTNLILERK